MKTLVVLDNNCGEETEAFYNWLCENLPEDIELDFRWRVSGVGGGLFSADGSEIEGMQNYYWEKYCNS